MIQPLEFVIETPITGARILREVAYPFAGGNLTRIDVISDTAAAGGAATFDVLLNGATIFPGGVGRPAIAIGATVASAVLGAPVAVVRNDKLRITLAGVTGSIGGRLYIYLTFDDGVSTGGVLAGDVTGASGANTVEKIRGRGVPAMPFPASVLRYDEYITWTHQVHLGDSGGAGGTGANGFIQSNQSYWYQAGADGTEVSTPGDAVIFYWTLIAFNAGANIGLGAQDVNPGANGADINLRWHVKGDYSGTAAVFENTGAGEVIKTAYFAVTNATVFKIEVGADGSVKYYLDGVLKYTSAIPAATIKAWALRPQVSLGYYGGNSPEAPNANGYSGCNTAHIRIEGLAADVVKDGAGLYWSAALQTFEAAVRLAGIDIVGTPTDGATPYYVASSNRIEWRVLSPAVISGAGEEDIAWSSLTGAISVAAGNRLLTSADWDAVTHNGARALQTIQAIGGYVKVVVGGAGQNTRYIGLRNSAADHVSNNIDPYRVQVRGGWYI